MKKTYETWTIGDLRAELDRLRFVEAERGCALTAANFAYDDAKEERIALASLINRRREALYRRTR